MIDIKPGDRRVFFLYVYLLCLCTGIKMLIFAHAAAGHGYQIVNRRGTKPDGLDEGR